MRQVDGLESQPRPPQELAKRPIESGQEGRSFHFGSLGVAPLRARTWTYRDARANGSAGGLSSFGCLLLPALELWGGGGDDIVGSPHIFLVGGTVHACLARLQQTEFLSRIACIYLQPPSSWSSIPACFFSFSPSNLVSLLAFSFLSVRYPRYPSSDVALISSSYLGPAAFPTHRRYTPAPPSNQPP